MKFYISFATFITTVLLSSIVFGVTSKTFSFNQTIVSEKVNLNTRDTPLMDAIKRNDVDTFNTLMYTGIPETSKSNIVAFLKNGYRNIKISLAIEERNDFDNTPLMIACALGRIEMVEQLIAAHNKLSDNDWINWTNGRGSTALHIAIRNKQNEISNILLEQEGIDIEIENSIGDTPFIEAIETGNYAMVEIIYNRLSSMKGDGASIWSSN